MKRAVTVIAVVLGFLALWGCSKTLTAQDLAGAWDGTIQIPDEDLLKQLKAMGKSDKDLPEFRKQIETFGKFPLDLNRDMTFTLGSGMGAATGKWSLANDTVTLTVEKVQGMSVDQIVKLAPQRKDEFKPLTWKVSKDGASMSGEMPNPGGPKVPANFKKRTKS